MGAKYCNTALRNLASPPYLHDCYTRLASFGAGGHPDESCRAGAECHLRHYP
jgi:hypothetical protein